eukprot:scaffold33643_cov42-Prasinocladus_malaysianus.AAC.1
MAYENFIPSPVWPCRDGHTIRRGVIVSAELFWRVCQVKDTKGRAFIVDCSPWKKSSQESSFNLVMILKYRKAHTLIEYPS